MDLNLDNYSDIEIINLLHLPIKDTYTLPELKNNTLDHVKVILNTDDDVIGNKRDITDFFIKAFLRLAKNYNVKVDPFEMPSTLFWFQNGPYLQRRKHNQVILS